MIFTQPIIIDGGLQKVIKVKGGGNMYKADKLLYSVTIIVIALIIIVTILFYI